MILGQEQINRPVKQNYVWVCVENRHVKVSSHGEMKESFVRM
jgi:hypothetical protein